MLMVAEVKSLVDVIHTLSMLSITNNNIIIWNSKPWDEVSDNPQQLINVTTTIK